ncbi:hypothetical protein [Gluconobacter oxydans]|uniref:Uncharacterized protein n=1 Tax=Gluconobacter oxydans TaxID=442 RepID=A0AB35ARQ2_GLUOY|nr:hypothetical protein [Gluconobacter oxydans]MBF0857586.1 hypothetical protein [Gluconobacter oxydans]TCW19370.1 hypothetical protein EDC20_1726 [Gluconobacter oxydans]
MSKAQLSFFDTSALGGANANLFWGELPGDKALEEAAKVVAQAVRDGPHFSDRAISYHLA